MPLPLVLLVVDTALADELVVVADTALADELVVVADTVLAVELVVVAVVAVVEVLERLRLKTLLPMQVSEVLVDC